MKNWYLGSLKEKKHKFFTEYTEGDIKEGKDVPYNFYQVISSQMRSKLKGGMISDLHQREYIDHYNNYNKNILSTEVNSNNNNHIKEYTLHYDDSGDYFYASNVKLEHRSTRQLTHFLHQIVAPKTYVKREYQNVLLNKKKDTKLLSLIYNKKYDEYLSKSELDVLNKIRSSSPKPPFSVDVWLSNPDTRYMFTSIEYITKKVIGRSGKKDKSIKVKSKYVKQVPPYPFWHMYDPKIDSYIVDLREFQKYCEDINIYDIDFASYPFMLGGSDVPKGLTKFVKMEYNLKFPIKDFNVDGIVLDQVGVTDLSIDSKSSQKRIMYKYRSDYNHFSRERIVVDDSTPLSIRISRDDNSDSMKSFLKRLASLKASPSSFDKYL